MDHLSEMHGVAGNRWGADNLDLLLKHYELRVLPTLKLLFTGSAARISHDNHCTKRTDKASVHGEGSFKILNTTMFQVYPLKWNVKINPDQPLVPAYDPLRVFGYFEDLGNSLCGIIGESNPARAFSCDIKEFAPDMCEATERFPSLCDTIPLKQGLYNYGTYENFENKVMWEVYQVLGDASIVFCCADYEGDTNLKKMFTHYFSTDFQPTPKQLLMKEFLKKYIQLPALFHIQQKLVIGLFSNHWRFGSWFSGALPR